MRTASIGEERSRPGVGSDARERLLAAMSVTDRRLDLAGISTAVLEGGHGPPAILLHGAGEFAATWMRVIPEMTARHQVIAPDLPGHGASAMARPLDSNRVLAWLGELIEHTCERPPILAGHLLGGAIAARFASQHGHRISALVLVDSLGLGPFRPSPRFALAMLGFIARPSERTQDRLFRRCFVDLDVIGEQMGEEWDALARYGLECARTPALQASLRSLMPQFGMPAIPPSELRRITVPTALIWGREDLQARLRVAEAASTRYGWPLQVIESAADDPAIEQPHRFLDAWRRVLRRLSEARGASVNPRGADATDADRSAWSVQ